ncbi:hypothetical protein [Streptomyces sp. SID3343]|uniref:hypothetical protein n=1 Tax=Streptomyces sp. SID3343 TaxID=2690260 RepID=UPI00136D075A|nr:hypothetical protein [Streptomyces sp. SID3343]MYW05802.1 hypothetical protein [Streptomyces sp. SID3343]
MNRARGSDRSPHTDARLLVAGAALTAGGAMIASAGVGLAAFAAAAAGRRLMRRLEEPARERAADTLRRTREASRAGRDAWRTAGDEPCS